MNLFTRKMRLFCVSNIMVSFVCTGFLGINGYKTESATENAHEVSPIASDMEPVSQNGEGENSLFVCVLEGANAMIDRQQIVLENQSPVNSIIGRSEKPPQEKTSNLADQKEKNTKKTTSNTKKNTTKSSNKVTNVVTKKEVKNNVTYAPAKYSSVTGDAIVSYAKKYLGLRYKSGTPSLTSGADCSGFTMLIYREFGVSLPRTVSGQTGRGTYVNKKDLQKGDLVFYKQKGSRGGASHVAIYIGNGQVIHESRPGVGVKISTVNMMQYVTARRVINNKAKQIAEQKQLEEQKKNETITDNASNNITNNTDLSNNANNGNTVNNSVVDSNVVNNTNTETTDNTKEETKQEEKTENKTEVVEKKEESKQESSEASSSQE